jgi:Cu(I)/Ag(I) efflux system membrane protein CusA/SilA
VIFLFHVRSALVAIVTLPIAIILSFIAIYYLNLTSNIMSLGGIAIAIGAMVDAAIVMVENAHKRLEQWEEAGRPGAQPGSYRCGEGGREAAIFFPLDHYGFLSADFHPRGSGREAL